MAIFDAMMEASILAQMAMNDATLAVKREFVMSPQAFEELRLANNQHNHGFLFKRPIDDVFEFFNTPIRIDPEQKEWKLSLIDTGQNKAEEPHG